MNIYTINMIVSVVPNQKMTATSRVYRGNTAEKRCRADARKFSKNSGRMTHIYRVKNGSVENPWFYYYFAVPSEGFNYNGEHVETISWEGAIEI
jgi:hypothetical protein